MAPGQCSVDRRAVGHQLCLRSAGTVIKHSRNLSCEQPGPNGSVLQMARLAEQHRNHKPGSREGDVSVWCFWSSVCRNSLSADLVLAKAAVSE